MDVRLDPWMLSADGAIEPGGDDPIGAKWDRGALTRPRLDLSWRGEMGFSTGGTINASPTIGADGTIYVGSQDGNLYSVKPDGMQKRAFDTGAEVNSSPTIGTNGTIYVGSLDGNLYAVHSESGGFATHLGPCSSTISVTVDK